MIFNKQSSATKVLDKFEVSPIRRLLSFIWYKVFCQSKSKIDNTYFDGNRLEIERAPEPTDVFWGNLHVSTSTRIKTTFKTYFATLIVLGAVFGINLGINIWKSDLESSGGNNGAIRLLTIFMSFFVVFFNTLLGRVIRIFSAFEKHETYTKYNLSVAVKLTFAMFVNTALIPVLVNVELEDWFTNAGLVVDAFYNLLSVCFFSPLSYYFNPFYGIKLLRQRAEESKGADSKLTQRKANSLFEGPPLDMAQRYANTMLIYIMTVFFAPLMAIAPVVGLGGNIFSYWVEKYLLLRRHRRPEEMGPTIAFFFANSIPWFMLLYAISNFVWVNRLSDGQNSPGLVGLILMSIYIVLPIRSYINKKFGADIFRFDEHTYQKNKHQFLADYKTENPMTRKEALEENAAEEAQAAAEEAKKGGAGFGARMFQAGKGMVMNFGRGMQRAMAPGIAMMRRPAA